MGPRLAPGPVHRGRFESPKEARTRTLAEQQATIRKLEARCAALEQTLGTITRLARPYVPDDGKSKHNGSRITMPRAGRVGFT